EEDRDEDRGDRAARGRPRRRGLLHGEEVEEDDHGERRHQRGGPPGRAVRLVDLRPALGRRDWIHRVGGPGLLLGGEIILLGPRDTDMRYHGLAWRLVLGWGSLLPVLAPPARGGDFSWTREQEREIASRERRVARAESGGDDWFHIASRDYEVYTA